MIPVASVRPSPDPPYCCGIIAASQPAFVSASTKASGYVLCSSTWRWYSSGNSAHSARTASRISWCRSVMCLSMVVVSADLGARLHGEVPLVVARPQRDAAVAVVPAAKREAMDVEQGADGLELEAPYSGLRKLATQQVDQQGRDQRPVHDQARVAFRVGGVGPVIVDAVTVEGQRGIAEEEHRVGLHLAPEPFVGGRRCWLGLRGAGQRGGHNPIAPALTGADPVGKPSEVGRLIHAFNSSAGMANWRPIIVRAK